NSSASKGHPSRPSPTYSPGTNAIEEKTESLGSPLRTSGKCSRTCFVASNSTHSHVRRSPNDNKSTSDPRVLNTTSYRSKIRDTQAGLFRLLFDVTLPQNFDVLGINGWYRLASPLGLLGKHRFKLR